MRTSPRNAKSTLTHPNGARKFVIPTIERYAPHYDEVVNYFEQPQDNSTAPNPHPRQKERCDYKKLRAENKNRARQQKHYHKKRDLSIHVCLL